MEYYNSDKLTSHKNLLSKAYYIIKIKTIDMYVLYKMKTKYNRYQAKWKTREKYVKLLFYMYKLNIQVTTLFARNFMRIFYGWIGSIVSVRPSLHIAVDRGQTNLSLERLPFTFLLLTNSHRLPQISVPDGKKGLKIEHFYIFWKIPRWILISNLIEKISLALSEKYTFWYTLYLICRTSYKAGSMWNWTCLSIRSRT